MGSIPVAGAKKTKLPTEAISFFTKGIEGGAVVNDMPVACQSRGVTEPAGENDSRCGCQRQSNWLPFFFALPRFRYG